jgi:hypothetical protein
MGVMLQAFYWDCPKAENCEHAWWKFIKSKLPAIVEAVERTELCLSSVMMTIVSAIRLRIAGFDAPREG